MATKGVTPQGPGIGVDAKGGPVVDPTANVIALNEASIKRVDDMNVLLERLTDEKIRRMEEGIKVRAEITEMRSIYVKELMALRAEQQKELREQESKRLDAVRSVDQLAVKTESDRSTVAITALAAVHATTAETLRSAVNTSATNLATQLVSTVSAITERIASLEKASFTASGKQQVADPQIDRLAQMVERLVSHQAALDGKAGVVEPQIDRLALMVERLVAHQASMEGKAGVLDPQLERLAQMVEKLVASQASIVGKSEGIGMSWGILMGILGLVFGLVASGVTLYTVFAPNHQQQQTSPQIVYSLPSGPSSPSGLVPKSSVEK